MATEETSTSKNLTGCLLEKGKAGDLQAQYKLGCKYLDGDGVEQDHEQALHWLEKAATAGMAEAQNKLGNLYARGVGVEQNYEKAFEYYTLAAEQAYPNAQYNMGLAYYYGRGTAVNLPLSAHWLKKAADQGLALAHYNLACAYLKGEGVEQDTHQALEHYSKSASAGLNQAFLQLGHIYGWGEYLEPDLEKAFEAYIAGAEQGHGMCQFYASECYLHGKGVEHNTDKAMTLLTQAKNQDIGHAYYRLGLIYYHGHADIAQDLEKAFSYFQAGAEANDWDCLISVSYCYIQGEGVERDPEKALSLLTQAAKDLVPKSHYQLGVLYHWGDDGIPQDLEKGLSYFLAGAELGDEHCQVMAGTCYRYGKGTAKNTEQAVAYLTQAVEQNAPQSHYQLGTLYNQGDEGIPQDLEKAFTYFRAGAELGDEDCQVMAGFCYRQGEGVDKNIEKAVAYLTQAVEQNAPQSHYILGYIYYEGDDGVPQDLEKAFSYFRAGAELGDEDCRQMIENA